MSTATKPAAVEAPPAPPEFVGIVTSASSKTVSAPFTGRIQKVEVHHGQHIKKGDPIARLDDNDLKLKIAEEIGNEKAALAESGAAGAGAGPACNVAVQVEKAFRMRARSWSDVMKARGECAAAGANSGVGAAKATTARARRAVLEHQLEQTVITSPVDGVVMTVKMKEGAVTNQGEPLARVANPADLRIKFPVDKEYRRLVQSGGRVELKIDGVERPLWAVIDRITTEEAPITFSIVEADLDDSKLGPDEVQLAAEVHIRLADRGTTRATGSTPVATGAVR